MKIVLLTAKFSQKGGGVATVSRLLVRGLRARNHQVMVLTSEEGLGEPTAGIISRPSPLDLIWQIYTCDAVIMQGCILKLGWPLLLVRRKAILVRHIFELRKAFPVSWLENRCVLATVSRYMASHESIPCRILPNPYDNDYFYNKSSLRDRDFIFVGRLIEQKGLMILLKAFVVLSKDGDCSLTIIGEGSQKEIGEDYVRKIGLEDRVDFLGHQDAPQVANQMRRHKVVVVPSIWEEPFGLVVLEGLACGCRVVAANRGGIPEGLNGLGILYEAEDVADLARALREQLSESVLMPEKQALCQHLEWHQPANVAMEYENLLLKN